jgi:hypothetical protein
MTFVRLHAPVGYGITSLVQKQRGPRQQFAASHLIWNLYLFPAQDRLHIQSGLRVQAWEERRRDAVRHIYNYGRFDG